MGTIFDAVINPARNDEHGDDVVAVGLGCTIGPFIDGLFAGIDGDAKRDIGTIRAAFIGGSGDEHPKHRLTQLNIADHGLILLSIPRGDRCLG